MTTIPWIWLYFVVALVLIVTVSDACILVNIQVGILKVFEVLGLASQTGRIYNGNIDPSA